MDTSIYRFCSGRTIDGGMALLYNVIFYSSNLGLKKKNVRLMEDQIHVEEIKPINRHSYKSNKHILVNAKSIYTHVCHKN